MYWTIFMPHQKKETSKMNTTNCETSSHWRLQHPYVLYGKMWPNAHQLHYEQQNLEEDKALLPPQIWPFSVSSYSQVLWGKMTNWRFWQHLIRGLTLLGYDQKVIAHGTAFERLSVAIRLNRLEVKYSIHWPPEGNIRHCRLTLPKLKQKQSVLLQKM
jgi:hypothetical protein